MLRITEMTMVVPCDMDGVSSSVFFLFTWDYVDNHKIQFLYNNLHVCVVCEAIINYAFSYTLFMLTHAHLLTF